MRPINEEPVLIKIYIVIAAGLSAAIIFSYIFG